MAGSATASRVTTPQVAYPPDLAITRFGALVHQGLDRPETQASAAASHHDRFVLEAHRPAPRFVSDEPKTFGVANYEDTVGLRNSHDKSFPIGIAFGSRVFVCDNMAFMADHVIKRRHTVNLKRDLPGLVGELIEPPGRPSRTTAPHLRALPAHDAHGRARRSRRTQHVPRGHINVQRTPEVLKEWDAPTFEEFQTARSAWRLFNAATFALTGRVTDNPNATPKLHKVIDGVCN